MKPKYTDFWSALEIVLDKQDATLPENFVKWCGVVKVALEHFLYNNTRCGQR